MKGAGNTLPLASCSFLLIAAMLAFPGITSSQQSAPPSRQQKPESSPDEKPPISSGKPAERHSTPEDRKRLVTVAHKLEAAPLDPALTPERDWAMQWVVSTPDLHVRICTSLLADLRRPKYKYRTQISDQLLISSAAFLIEHPDKGESIPVQSVGGMEGVLKTYSAILKVDPQATAKSLDDLLQKQKEGKLAETVQQMVSGCH